MKPTRAQVSSQERALRDITEADLQRQVISLARSLGWGTTLAARKALVAEAATFQIDPGPLDGLVFHPRYSLGSEPGWPDLTLIRARDRRLVFAELKREKGVTSDRQAEVLELLRRLTTEPALCGEGPHGDRRPEPRLECCPGWIEVHVWRPSDLASGAIAEVLR